MARLSRTRKTTSRNAELSAIKRQRTARLTRIAARAALLQRRGKEDEAYTLICDEFVALGGIYVKFLQGVLLNSPIMKRWHNPDKLKIFENLEAEPLDIFTFLRAELGVEKFSQFAKLQTTPFASGSFGQVYYGELRNGEQIIVKVLRPQVRELLLHDLRLLGLFTRFFGKRHYKDIDLKLSDAIKDFRRATLGETDYVHEAAFANEIYKAEYNNPDLIVPKTYLDLCTPQIIVQDFIGGISCAEVLEQQTRNGIEPAAYVQQRLHSDLSIQLETLGIALLTGCFSHPRVMGDPHPGNIRLLPDNKVGLIDFGISAAAPRNRQAFFGLISEWAHMYDGTLNVANLFEQFLRVFMNDLYRALRRLLSYQPKSEQAARQNMLKNVSGIISELFDDESQSVDLEDTMSQGRVVRLFNQVINKGNRLGLVLHFEDSEILRAAQTYMSLVEALGLRGKVLAVVFNTTIRDALREHPELSGISEPQITTSKALEIVNSWLERVANQDPLLFSRLLEQFSPSDKISAKDVNTEEQHA